MDFKRIDARELKTHVHINTYTECSDQHIPNTQKDRKTQKSIKWVMGKQSVVDLSREYYSAMKRNDALNQAPVRMKFGKWKKTDTKVT